MGKRGYGFDRRMNKKVQAGSSPNLNAGSTDLYSFQLEGGDEECQIKRIVLSLGNLDAVGMVKLALNDEAFTNVNQFSDDRVLYTFESSGSGIINETTTVRVPRGWFLGIQVTNRTTAPMPYGMSCQLNYLVIS